MKRIREYAQAELRDQLRELYNEGITGLFQRIQSWDTVRTTRLEDLHYWLEEPLLCEVV